MISKGSCDTEYWSNDAENSALHHRNKLDFKIYLNRKQLAIFSCCIFDQINAALVSRRDLFETHLKNIEKSKNVL